MRHVIISPAPSIYTYDWQQGSDVTLCKPPTEDKCGHRSSMPNHIKPKIIT
jgi:hypothetical protein